MPPTPPKVPKATSAQHEVAKKSLEASHRAAQKVIEDDGIDDLRRDLEEAQESLVERIEALSAKGLDLAFTTVQLRVCLLQIQEVLGPLLNNMGGTISATAQKAAEAASVMAVESLDMSERLFSGIASQPLALDRAMLFDIGVEGVNASTLRRLAVGPEAAEEEEAEAEAVEGGHRRRKKKHPRSLAKRGILERYGLGVIGGFEHKMKMGVLTKKSWREMRDDLTDESEFLQGKPKFWAERILRTETMSAAGRAQLKTAKAANEQFGDVVKILSCVFDERTGSDSIAAHGQIRRPDEEFESWNGTFDHPADRPNDRAVITIHRTVWPIPEYLQVRPWDEVLMRWKAEGRKGAPPPRPDPMTTVPLSSFGRG